MIRLQVIPFQVIQSENGEGELEKLKCCHLISGSATKLNFEFRFRKEGESQNRIPPSVKWE